MAKIWAALLIVTAFLMLAPVIESGTSGSTQFFQAIGAADGGGGGVDGGGGGVDGGGGGV